MLKVCGCWVSSTAYITLEMVHLVQISLTSGGKGFGFHLSKRNLGSQDQ